MCQVNTIARVHEFYFVKRSLWVHHSKKKLKSTAAGSPIAKTQKNVKNLWLISGCCGCPYYIKKRKHPEKHKK